MSKHFSLMMLPVVLGAALYSCTEGVLPEESANGGGKYGNQAE